MPAKRPNILLLIADQHRADCLGIAGRYPVRTPHLDRLAREGAWFSHAFTPIPVCGPARQALLTGMAPDCSGALWNADFLTTPAPLPSERFVMAGLKRAGYHSALIGKWNLSQEHGPADFGFDTYIPWENWTADCQSRYPGQVFSHGWFGDENAMPVSDSRTHWAARQASGLMAAWQNEQEPWLIRIDFSDPHLPCRPSQPFASLFDPADMPPWPSWPDPLCQKPYIQRQQIVNWRLENMEWTEWSRTVALYCGMIAQLDDAVGLMLNQLDQLGLAGDTLVVYTSDHGDLCGGHGMLDKHYVLYDDVTQVPLLMRLPGRIREGSRIDGYVSNMLDLGTTLAGLCSLEGVDPGHGQSMVPLLDGLEQDGRDCAVCSANGQQFGLYAQRSLRTDDWLYVWNMTDIDELYDVRLDPGQIVNRVSDPAVQPVLKQLRIRLLAELRRRADPFARTSWLEGQLAEGRKLAHPENETQTLAVQDVKSEC